MLHLGLRLYVLTELTQMQREGVFFYNFSYSWFFYQPGGREEGSVFLRFFHIYEFFISQVPREGGVWETNVPHSGILGSASSSLSCCCLVYTMLYTTSAPPVNHQCTTTTTSEPAAVPRVLSLQCSAMLNRSLMQCTVILQCNTLKYCTALLGVEVVV